MKLVIDRALWLRGEGPDESGLLVDDRMCCLGFFAKQCGITDEELLQATKFPSELPDEESQKMPGWLFDGDGKHGRDEESEVGNLLMNINDAQIGLLLADVFLDSEEERERRLSEIFKKHGIEVEFIGPPKSELEDDGG